MTEEKSLSIANPHSGIDIIQKIGVALAAIGTIVLLIAWADIKISHHGALLALSITSILLGSIIYGVRTYLTVPEGIKNNNVWHSSFTNGGVLGWLAGIILTGFYIELYWFPSLLGLGADGAKNTGIVALFDPLSQFIKGQPASQWFVYGTIYTLLILALGIKFMLKYRHNRYQLIRTIVVIISQLFLAYLIPEILEGLNTKGGYFAKDLKYMWPLNYYFFESWHLNNMVDGGNLGKFYLVWGIFSFMIATPVITYFVGKRWYCSWVCGCGGLAETAGDPFRQLSSKKVYAWNIERWLIHSIMIFIFIVTCVVLYGYFTGSDTFLGLSIYSHFSKPYGFLIGSMFSGVIGVGFYPMLGNRVWCRFGCPLAGYMGLVQRFKSKFRITTNGGQCISCGNCSTYCEQGIDVRWYAQRGQDIVRASCVGCGICSAVCPRGVLKLENGDTERRDQPISMINGKIELTN